MSEPVKAVDSVAVEEPAEPTAEKEFDFSNVDPKEFVCFGTFEENHAECGGCPFKVPCAEKAGK